MNVATILTVIELLSPSSKAAEQTHFPGWEETVQERHSRYEIIAKDVEAVLEEKGSFPGMDRADSVALTLAVIYHESGFARDVHLGPCYRGPGWEKRCDSGRAVCLMQVQASPATSKRIAADTQECIRWGVSAINYSLKLCKESPEETRLAGLSGSCKRGHAGAKRIWSIFKRTSALVRTVKESS